MEVTYVSRVEQILFLSLLNPLSLGDASAQEADERLVGYAPPAFVSSGVFSTEPLGKKRW
jgi:hypothetical protein